MPMVLLAAALTKTFRPRSWTIVALLLVGVLGGLVLHDATAQQSIAPATDQGRRIALRDQLVSGLRATTKTDLEFIDKVVLQVEQGKLPRRLVDGTFHWARQRAARRGPMRALRPMVYFRPGLSARAERIGVQL